MSYREELMELPFDKLLEEARAVAAKREIALKLEQDWTAQVKRLASEIPKVCYSATPIKPPQQLLDRLTTTLNKLNDVQDILAVRVSEEAWELVITRPADTSEVKQADAAA